MTDYPLPPSSEIAVDRLAGVFNQVTNSYKFFWFLALLDHVKRHQSPIIPIADLLAQMVALVWYPSTYYRLYFGKQDQLRNIAEQLQQVTGLPADAKTERVRALAREGKALGGRGLLMLGDYVPYRFARPFVAEQTRNLPDQHVNAAVQEALNDKFMTDPSAVPYRFVPPDALELSPRWRSYLIAHNEILTGFCLWHLTKYLQGHNPNVTNIPAKLYPPLARDMKQARRFWETALAVRGSLTCIYSGRPLVSGSFSLDHFLPWRYVAHDLTWNLIPTPKEVNSSKSDRLPDTALYFDRFARMQYDGVRAVIETRKLSLLEDHVLLMRLESEQELAALPYDRFRQELRDTIIPQFHIARNMGFSPDWRYE